MYPVRLILTAGILLVKIWDIIERRRTRKRIISTPYNVTCTECGSIYVTHNLMYCDKCHKNNCLSLT